MRRFGRLAGAVGFAVLSLAMFSVCFAAGSFSIQVDDTAGLDEAWPLTCGLPFPEGALKDPANIRILRNGEEIAAQVDVAATWRDGSVQWALAGFAGDPNADYRAEYGSGVVRREFAGLTVAEDASGRRLVVNTGAAVYEFMPDRLLPERMRMEGQAILSGSGDGAYLVDNRGRTARVAGPAAEVTSEILKRGSVRLVLRREGWYVTPEGERVAKAVAWFYFSANSPFVRVTHSLILTEDTNEVWVRDYGLEFRTATAPSRATFALGEAGEEELFAAASESGEVYLLQDTYPHFLEREFRAEVGRSSLGGSRTLREMDVAGDWADAAFDGYGLTLATPFLAQRFPKEIAFGPQGARVALWSGRSGRELDFRAPTLVKEYWESWSDRAPGGAAALAEHPSNAQAAARTHDVWLMPRLGEIDEATLRARGRAAARRPLALADPEWLCATEAIGWPVHPMDAERFPREEQMIADFWDRLMSGYESMPMTGFIAFGCNPYIRGSQFFRLSRLVDYGMRRHVWGLYARSGDRRYYEYAARFNQFAGDWEMAHIDAGDKFRGGFAIGSPYNTIHLPFYWGDSSQVLQNDISGHDIRNWMLEHYFTGDERPLELTRMFGKAMRERWDTDAVVNGASPFMILRVLTNLYSRDWEEDFGEMARDLAARLIDLSNKVGLTDEMKYGALYKMDRNALALYDYYRTTGDEAAKEAVLRTVDYKYRFDVIPPPIAYQNAGAILFTIAYQWTGQPAYLRVANQLVASGLESRTGGSGPHLNMHPTLGMPAAMTAIAKADEPIAPYPLVEFTDKPGDSKLLFRKADGAQVLTMRAFVRMADDSEAKAVVSAYRSDGAAEPLAGVEMDAEVPFRTRYDNRFDSRGRHCRVSIPAEAPAGLYVLEFPGAEKVVLQECGAEQFGLIAPRGLWLRGEGFPYYFRVGEDTDALRFIVGRPMELRRPDGSVAVEESNLNLGEMEAPVGADAGVWSVRSWHAGYFRLLNAEPVFAQSRREWLPEGTDIDPAERFQPEPAGTEFVPAPAGRALYMPGDRTLRFPRGEKRGNGYAHFPGDEGTIEFWFRPNWSSTDLPVPSGQLRAFHFLRAGSHDAQYQYGERGWHAGTFAAMSLWTQGRAGDAQASPGFKGWRFFNGGEWRHVAITWRLSEARQGTEGQFIIFVDGKALPPVNTSSPSFPGQLSGRTPFQLDEPAEWLTVGPIDGAIAQLRISDTVRYEDDFEPQNTLAADANTRVFFPLDGDREGTTSTGDTIAIEE